MIDKSERSVTIDEADEFGEYVRLYYPGGTKQAKGSDLDAMVKLGRNHALRMIEERVHELQRNGRNP